MKAMNLGLFVMLAQVFALNANAQKKTAQELMKEDSYESPAGQLFVEEDYMAGNSVLNNFDNVIIVNKAAKGTTAQTLKMYSKGSFILETKVSTGRENVEIVKGAKRLFRKLLGTKGTTTSHWRHTTRGYYPVQRVEEANYASGESGFHMPYAMFFNSDHGLAIHQVPPDLSGGEAAGESQLGGRASSGCVRVHKNTIQDIHRLVIEAGKGLVPAMDIKTGTAVLNADGTMKMVNGYRTIVIVQELID